MTWAILAAVGITLAGVGGVMLAWGSIMLAPAGWAGGAIGGGGTFPDDHPIQRKQRTRRRVYQGAAALFVIGSALQIVAAFGLAAPDDLPKQPTIASVPDYTIVAKNLYLQSQGSAGGRSGYYVTVAVQSVDRETFLGPQSGGVPPCFTDARVGDTLPVECR